MDPFLNTVGVVIQPPQNPLLIVHVGSSIKDSKSSAQRRPRATSEQYPSDIFSRRAISLLGNPAARISRARLATSSVTTPRHKSLSSPDFSIRTAHFSS